jgi:alginate O-acetyltransferase complex protein AlgI
MIFADVRFVLLVIGCWISFFAVPRRFRSSVLVVWGLAFYAIYASAFLPLVIELVVATYLIGRGRADVVLIGAMILLFADFKLGVDLTGLTAALAGRRSTPVSASVIVPLGFSFLAFELMHFALERRRNRIPDASLAELGAFALFFPCRIAGPIKRYPPFTEAVRQAERTVANVYAGVVRVLIGVFKKVVLADVLSLTAGEIAYASTPAQVWKVMLAYSLQIYLYFSAYSDMAIGFSQMLGIAVPENFNWPYLAPNIQEFWSRWHMTLSGWVRDYVFTPSGRALFKTRLKATPTAIACVAYLLTFLVIGAWHGATPGYLVWGMYHALLLIAYYVYRTRVPAAVAASRWWASRAVTAASTAFTFVLVTIGWLPFRTDLTNSLRLLRLMFGAH